jgi:hypothetical protein
MSKFGQVIKIQGKTNAQKPTHMPQYQYNNTKTGSALVLDR